MFSVLHLSYNLPCRVVQPRLRGVQILLHPHLYDLTLLSIPLLGFFVSVLEEGKSAKKSENLKKALESLYKTRQKQGLLYFFMLIFRTILNTG